MTENRNHSPKQNVLLDMTRLLPSTSMTHSSSSSCISVDADDEPSYRLIQDDEASISSGSFENKNCNDIKNHSNSSFLQDKPLDISQSHDDHLTERNRYLSEKKPKIAPQQTSIQIMYDKSPSISCGRMFKQISIQEHVILEHRESTECKLALKRKHENTVPSDVHKKCKIDELKSCRDRVRQILTNRLTCIMKGKTESLEKSVGAIEQHIFLNGFYEKQHETCLGSPKIESQGYFQSHDNSINECDLMTEQHLKQYLKIILESSIHQRLKKKMYLSNNRILQLRRAITMQCSFDLPPKIASMKADSHEYILADEVGKSTVGSPINHYSSSSSSVLPLDLFRRTCNVVSTIQKIRYTINTILKLNVEYNLKSVKSHGGFSIPTELKELLFNTPLLFAYENAPIKKFTSIQWYDLTQQAETNLRLYQNTDLYRLSKPFLENSDFLSRCRCTTSLCCS